MRKLDYHRDDLYEELKEMAAHADAFPEWAKYFSYVRLLGSGLRHEALANLDDFIHENLSSPFTERRRFVSWIYYLTYTSNWLTTFVPQPLRVRLIEPTLLEWIEREPTSSEPHCWMGFIDHLRIAVELDGQNEAACRQFIRCVLGGVHYDTHELPYGFVGTDPYEDLADLCAAEKLLSVIDDVKERTLFGEQIARERALIEEYVNRGKLE